MVQSYFLVLDDSGRSTRGKYAWCGSKCARHVFTIKSPVDQVLEISVNVWPERSYPVECQDAVSDKNGNHLARLNHSSTLQGFTKGETIFDPMTVKADEVVNLELEFDWTRNDISKDFSVVVWSTIAKVEIDHDR